MKQLIQLLASLVKQYNGLIATKNYVTPIGEKIYQTGKSKIGQDIAPTQNELGCAEAVCNIIKLATGEALSSTLSTTVLYGILLHHPKFSKVSYPRRGDIIISPTGYGNGTISNGHVGIISDNNRIMSNNSETGLWLEKFDFFDWDQRYKVKGGFPVVYFRRTL